MNVWAAETSCTNFVLHTKTNVANEVESCCMRKQQHAEEYLKNFIHCNLVSWDHWVQIMCNYWYILYFHVDIASLLWIKLNSFHLLSLHLEFIEYFQRVASLPTSISDKKQCLYQHVWGKWHKDNFFSSPYISETFISAETIHTV